MLDPTATSEDHRGGTLTGGRRGVARGAGHGRRHRCAGARVCRRGNGRVRPRPRRRVLLPRGQHPATGRASGDRGDHRARLGACATHRRRRSTAPTGGDRGDDHRPRDRSPAVRRGCDRRLSPGQRTGRPVADPLDRGPGRCRLHRRLDRLDVLRRDARQGDRLGADARRSRPTTRRTRSPVPDSTG